MQTAAVAASQVDHDHDVVFDTFADACRDAFNSNINAYGPHLFRVETGGLYEVYLETLPADERQHHTCNCCKQFIERFGGVVSITEDGRQVSAFWRDDLTGIYAAAAALLKRAVERRRVTGVFLSSSKVWGTPVTGKWTHFSVEAPRGLVYTGRPLTADQVMAAKREDFGTLSRGLLEFDRATVAQAVTLLEADALYRSEKVLGPAKFLLGLHDAVAGVTHQVRENLKWLAVASAPVGFATPRSSMIGTLLEDIAAGKSFDDVKRSFQAKMHPLQYQRPTAAPSAGNIKAAEKLVEELGIAPSLERRFARLDEIEKIWTPAPPKEAEKTEGVFGHLKAKGAETDRAPMNMPPQNVTWTKFARDVLPGARKIEVFTYGNANYCALLTAVHAEAPPILQWDLDHRRNPFSLYVYHGGSSPAHWNLPMNRWIEATAITLRPSMWFGAETNDAKNAIIILDGAKDIDNRELALFPETLKSSLHAARATIEAFSKSMKVVGMEEASACGLAVGGGGDSNRIRVTTDIGVAVYHIDRWD
jgi:hypothetical protein